MSAGHSPNLHTFNLTFRLDEITELPNERERDELPALPCTDDTKNEKQNNITDSSQTLHDKDSCETVETIGQDSTPAQLSLKCEPNSKESQIPIDAENNVCVKSCEHSKQTPTTSENDADGVSDVMEGNSAPAVVHGKELPLWRSKWKTSISRSLPGNQTRFLRLQLNTHSLKMKCYARLAGI